jgi:ABC-2 type transport system ATP-binding protein
LTLALARGPDLLVLDEPLARLDPLARHDFMALVMAAVAASGFSVIFSSHVVSELERFADYLIVLANGRVQMVGDIDDLLTSHKVLSGPAEESDLVGEQFTVVQTRKATRRAELLVRTTTGESQLPSGWESDDVSLEELVLAYLRDPSASMLPGPLAPDELKVSEVAR